MFTALFCFIYNVIYLNLDFITVCGIRNIEAILLSMLSRFCTFIHLNSKVITLADINISARSAIKVGKCDI